METFSPRQEAAIAATNKTVWWVFRVEDTLGNIYYWSTGSMVSSGNETIQVGAKEAPGVWTNNEWERVASFKVIDFSGISLRRSKSEAGIHAPNDVSFTIVNAGNVLDAANFTGGTVRIGLVIEDSVAKELCGSWRFRIKSASPYAQQIDVTCEDFLQEFLRGTYPTTRLISDIFPNSFGTDADNMCVPEPYGTCYIPLRSVYAVDGRYYFLGETTNTYTITAVRSPRSLGTKIEWTSGSFAFTQETKADAAAHDWRVFQPIIADSNNDGAVDACGLWLAGDRFLDMPTQFSRSDTATITSPADVLIRVLEQMGVSGSDLSLASFDAAKATFASWGLAWNFAFYYKEDRAAVLARLLAMCHSCLIVGETISIQVLSKASQGAITNADVLKTADVGPDTFRYSDALAEQTSDSGYVAFQEAGESQDAFIKILVPAKASVAVPDSETVAFPGVQDTQQVQVLGTLYYQRKFLKSADVSFSLKGTRLALRPDDVININYADYGGTYPVLIDEITINHDASLDVSAIRFSAGLDDWGDLAPAAITIASDTPGGVYSPVIAGPDSTGASAPPNLIPGRLRVGAGVNYLLLDPATPLRLSMFDTSVEKLRIGNLNGFLGYVSALYGIAIGDVTDYMTYDPTNGLRVSGKIQGGTIAGFTIDPTEGLYSGSGATRVQMKASVGIWAGATLESAAPFRVSTAGAVRADNATVTGTVNATGGYITNMTLGKTGVASGTLVLEVVDGTGDSYIAAGKTDFTNAQTGFIIGIDDSDSNTPKFFIGSPTKYLNWDGTTLTIEGAAISGVIGGTTADAFTVNSDLTDANADLVLGRTTGGNATLRWNGSLGSFDKSICLLMGLHVGGAADPGDNNLLVDGTGTIVGAFGCNAASAQTAYASGGALSAYSTGAFGLDSGANMSALHAMVVAIRAALVANGIMS
jgi:hypothetical protein